MKNTLNPESKDLAAVLTALEAAYQEQRDLTAELDELWKQDTANVFRAKAIELVNKLGPNITYDDLEKAFLDMPN